MYGRMEDELNQEGTHYSHNIILKLHAIRITNNFNFPTATWKSQSGDAQTFASTAVAMALFERARRCKWNDVNGILHMYLYFFHKPSICNAGNKSGRRSPGSVCAEKFNLRNIREPSGLIGNRNFG